MDQKSIEIDGILIHFIGLQELIQNKRAVGRPKDLEDIANLPDA